MSFDAVSGGSGPESGAQELRRRRASAAKSAGRGKSWSRKLVPDARSYLLQDITIRAGSRYCRALRRIFFFSPLPPPSTINSPSPERRAFFKRERRRNRDPQKVPQNLVMGDGYKVRSLISDIDPTVVGE